MISGPAHQFRQQRGAGEGCRGSTGGQQAFHAQRLHVFKGGERVASRVESTMEGDLGGTGERHQTPADFNVYRALLGQGAKCEAICASALGCRHVPAHGINFAGRVDEVAFAGPDEDVDFGTTGRQCDRCLDHPDARRDAPEVQGGAQLDTVGARRQGGLERSDGSGTHLEAQPPLEWDGQSSLGVRSGSGPPSSRGKTGRSRCWYPRRWRSWSTPPGVRARSQPAAAS